MIDIGGGRWASEHELAAEIPGRDDSDEERAACVAYLKKHRRRKASGNRAVKALGDAAAAFIRSSAARSPRELELEESLADAKRTIDRLLAFVPARAAEINAARIDELTSLLLREASRAFPSARQLVVLAQPEDESDTEACQRIEIRIVLDDGHDDATAIAAGITAVHRMFVEAATTQERRSVRLLVDPEFASA